MKVAVTGGAGFIGSTIVRDRLAMGDEVVAIDNLSRAALRGPHGPAEAKAALPAEAIFSFTDVRNSTRLATALRGARVIFHTAGQVAVTSSVEDPAEDFSVNTVGTFNVLEAARKNDATVVLCSTNKVYGENVNAVPLTEHSWGFEIRGPRFRNGIPESFPVDRTKHSPYGASKLAADLYAQEYAHTYGIRTGVFRMSCIYGEGQFGTEDQGWVAWFTIAHRLRKTITIFGDGRQARDVLHVSDLVRAFDAFVDRSSARGVYNMGGGPRNVLSLNMLLVLLANLSGKRPHTDRAATRPADQRLYISDIRKARSALGWKPTIRPTEGVRRLYQWATTSIKTG